ncbi:MAG: hypothetical protein ACLFR7_00060 [Opitutales bacterium]
MKVHPFRFLTFLCFAVAPLQAGLLLEMETSVPGQEDPEALTMKLQGTKLKMETPAIGGQQASLVFDAAKDELLTIDHNRRQYFRFDSEQVEEMAAMIKSAREQMEQALAEVPAAQRPMIERMMKNRMPDMPEPAPALQLERTDETKEIAGYTATLVRVLSEAGKVADAWIVPQDEVEGGEQFSEVLGKFGDFMQELVSAVPQSGEGAQDLTRVLGQLNGIPVATTSYADGAVESSSILRNLSEADIPDSEFAVPAGYREQKIEMPSMR